MSKLNFRLSYKNACILKHALRNQIEIKEIAMKYQPEIANEKFIKELEEEKRALETITSEIKKNKIGVK